MILTSKRMQGCQVTIYTSFYDSNRCFEETKQLKVIVGGDFLRRKIFSKCHILFATLRSVWLSLYVCFTARRYDSTIETRTRALHPFHFENHVPSIYILLMMMQTISIYCC